MKKAYSIIEILVVVAVMSVIGILSAQAITLSLKSTKKGDSIVLVKQELDYASESVERVLQTANLVTTPVCTATGSTSASITLRNPTGRVDLACHSFGAGDLAVAASYGDTVNFTSRFTSTKISVTSCSFTCYMQNSETYVDFSITANAKNISSQEGASVTTSRKVIIRGASKK